MSGLKNILVIWHLFESFPDKFVMRGVTIESPIESPNGKFQIPNSSDSRVQDRPYRGYLYPPKTNYISRLKWPGTTPGWVVGPFVGFAHGSIMASKLLVLDGIHGGWRWNCNWWYSTSFLQGWDCNHSSIQWMQLKVVCLCFLSCACAILPRHCSNEWRAHSKLAGRAYVSPFYWAVVVGSHHDKLEGSREWMWKGELHKGTGGAIFVQQ